MTIVACLLVLALVAQHILHSRDMADLNDQAAIERRALADRIQHPERMQVDPGERVEHEPPTDTAELAYVGREVPEFVNVGSED